MCYTCTGMNRGLVGVLQDCVQAYRMCIFMSAHGVFALVLSHFIALSNNFIQYSFRVLHVSM